MMAGKRAAQAVAAGALLALAAGAAAAQGPEVLFGLGWNALDGDDSAASGFVEARTGALVTLWGVEGRLGAAFQGDLDGDVFAGAGFVATLPLDDVFRLEAGVMPGWYGRDDGADLGSDFQVRSSLGFSVRVAPQTRVGLVVSHMSNAGTADENPGEDSAFAFVAIGF